MGTVSSFVRAVLVIILGNIAPRHIWIRERVRAIGRLIALTNRKHSSPDLEWARRQTDASCARRAITRIAPTNEFEGGERPQPKRRNLANVVSATYALAERRSF
jgi:hypothetical protein